MEACYFLYSETRNVMYVNDKPHTKLWSKYIRSKFPKDKWMLLDEKDSRFIDIITDPDKRATIKRISLIDRLDKEGKKLAHEISEVCEEYAISKIEEFTFVVAKLYRGEVNIVYTGPDAKKALTFLLTDRSVECVDVWKDGVFKESICDSHELVEKYINKNY